MQQIAHLDQLVDRTWGRADTFYDAGDAHHVSFADPYCPIVARHAVAAGERSGVHMHDGGTVVVIPGPRFATRAESRSYRAQGWDVINLETVFLFVWALAAQPLTGFMVFTFFLFVALLVLILLYVYKERLVEAVTE